MIYDSWKFKLAKPKKLTAKEKQVLAQENFDLWIPKAKEIFIDVENAHTGGYFS